MVGSIRRECTDHIIILNEDHLRNVLSSYFEYYHNDKTQFSLGKDTSGGCPILYRPAGKYKIIDLQRIGGLHHRSEEKKTVWNLNHSDIKSIGRSFPICSKNRFYLKISP
jgi:hypothetical protein